MSTTAPLEPASSRQLLWGTLTAAAVAAILLVAAVLPAEYGIDPTGIGKGLGLYRPRATPAMVAAPPTAADRAPAAARGLVQSQTPFRSDEMTLVLQPWEEAEIKAAMNQGQSMVFSWTAEGGALEVEMHGERVGAAESEFTSYWKDQSQGGHGTFEAAFAGTHGWYWQNLGEGPVTIKVRTSGFYQKLFRP